MCVCVRERERPGGGGGGGGGGVRYGKVSLFLKHWFKSKTTKQ